MDKNNNIIKHEILMSFMYSEPGEPLKHYIVYTGNTHNEDNELKVYGCIYDRLDTTKLEI